MAPVSGTPPLYYLATKYGGITVITRIYVPNPPSQTGILLSMIDEVEVIIAPHINKRRPTITFDAE